MDAGLLGVEVDEALELGVEEATSVSVAETRIIFSTPVTPTRERLTRVAGAAACASRLVTDRWWSRPSGKYEGRRDLGSRVST